MLSHSIIQASVHLLKRWQDNILWRWHQRVPLHVWNEKLLKPKNWAWCVAWSLSCNFSEYNQRGYLIINRNSKNGGTQARWNMQSFCKCVCTSVISHLLGKPSPTPARWNLLLTDFISHREVPGSPLGCFSFCVSILEHLKNISVFLACKTPATIA